ncbi:hypothetical protein AWB69_08112 [Caballeronia udeis]|uniref:Uncharacterized protein n=1 Tax=Caballeronia udeis TaxID=1232866 RepID=A0A158JJT0_9BURK|nr:hypothetical protein AWB69_08112 [Caballeronia udeis]
MIATHEFVVPRSIPMILLIFITSSHCRKFSLVRQISGFAPLSASKNNISPSIGISPGPEPGNLLKEEFAH